MARRKTTMVDSCGGVSASYFVPENDCSGEKPSYVASTASKPAPKENPKARAEALAAQEAQLRAQGNQFSRGTYRVVNNDSALRDMYFFALTPSADEAVGLIAGVAFVATAIATAWPIVAGTSVYTGVGSVSVAGATAAATPVVLASTTVIPGCEGGQLSGASVAEPACYNDVCGPDANDQGNTVQVAFSSVQRVIGFTDYTTTSSFSRTHQIPRATPNSTRRVVFNDVTAASIDTQDADVSKFISDLISNNPSGLKRFGTIQQTVEGYSVVRKVKELMGGKTTVDLRAETPLLQQVDASGNPVKANEYFYLNRSDRKYVQVGVDTPKIINQGAAKFGAVGNAVVYFPVTRTVDMEGNESFNVESYENPVMVNGEEALAAEADLGTGYYIHNGTDALTMARTLLDAGVSAQDVIDKSEAFVNFRTDAVKANDSIKMELASLAAEMAGEGIPYSIEVVSFEVNGEPGELSDLLTTTQNQLKVSAHINFDLTGSALNGAYGFRVTPEYQENYSDTQPAEQAQDTIDSPDITFVIDGGKENE
jgi:hypothetical protein